MSTSPQEKDKLRKRLQKLFEKHESLTKSKAGKFNLSNQQQNISEMNKMPKIKSPEQQHLKANNTELNKIISKKTKKQQLTKDKSKKVLKEEPKYNGFVKSPKKQNTESGLAKSKDIAPKKVKQQEKQERKSVAANASEKISPKKQSICNIELNPPKANKVKKQMPEDLKLKKTKNKTKVCNSRVCKKLKNKTKDNYLERNVKKAERELMFQKSDAAASSIKTNKTKKKKAKKRTASPDTSKNALQVSNKKIKLAKKTNNANKKLAKPNQKTKTIIFLSDSPSSAESFEDEFDVNKMTGFVGGGDFDPNSEKDEMENKYWMQEENYSENEYNSDNEHQGNNEIQKFEQKSQTNLEHYNQNDCYDSDHSIFNVENDYDEFKDYSDDSSDTHSDFGEDNYWEDEDSYSLSTDIEDNYSDDYDDFDSEMFHNLNNIIDDMGDDDDDYKLPDHVLEDLIIHEGTASKRNITPEDNVSFNSESQDAQIVELETHETIKVINQPKVYEKEELLKLKYEEKSSSSNTFHKKEAAASSSEDCPKLIPIEDEDGFQLYNPNDDIDDDDDEEENEEESLEDSTDDISLGSEYTEINSDDADSLQSEDINNKYLNRCDDDSGSSIDEILWNKKHKVDIIDATGDKCEKIVVANFADLSDTSLTDDIKQMPFVKLYENVDSKTESSILSATIIDSKIFAITNSDANEETGNGQSITVHDDPMETSQLEKESKTKQSPKVSKPGKIPGDYNTKFFNAFDSNLVMVLLRDPFYIYGTVRLTLLAGMVEVYGHSLNLGAEVEIFSPRGCSVIEISVSNKNYNITEEELKPLLESYERHFALADLKRIANLFNSETDAIVLLKRNEARRKMVLQFRKFMNENVFPNINNINGDRPLYNSEYLLRCMINNSAQEQKCLRLPTQWQELSVTAKSRVMLAGGKGVGKSTLLRYLINRYLPQKVLLIDLDIGQPEVFMPQTISCTIIKQPLLGPGFLLNLQPEIAYAIGHTNIALCAHKYIDAARNLIAYCKAQEAYNQIPWLINTMGYNKGFGLELISIIAQELPLTDIIQLQSTKEISNFDSILNAHELSRVPRIVFSEYDEKEQNIEEKLNYRLHVWQSAVQQESRYQKEWEMSAKDLRFAMLLSRLSDALQGHADFLTDIKPWSAPLDEVKIINLLDNTPTASVQELEKSIAANLVYLCHYEEDLQPLKCLGIGVVRAIDLHVRQLYLIPALCKNQLEYVNCVAIGEMPLPTSLFTNQGPRVKNIAPFVYNTIAANASRAIKQIYHRPRKFLTGKRKSLQ